MRVACDELSTKLGVPLVHFTYWYAAAEPIARLLETQTALLHACEAETSMMMALRPELVAEDRIELAMVNTSPSVPDVVGGGVYRWRTLASLSSAGVVGNPSAASREKGELLIDEIAKEIARKMTNSEFWALPWN
jgi:creatinine amidohydrolase